MARPEREPTRAVVWRRLDLAGTEHCRLWLDAAGARLQGTVHLAEAGTPLRLEYEVTCDKRWETRSLVATLMHGTTTRGLSLRVDERKRWWMNGEEMGAVRGCLDVDLSITPATNTLPIRRLRLSLGERKDVTAAWVRLPELQLEPLLQRYTRLGGRRYRYESRGNAFVAELEVDDFGLATSYPPFWECVAGCVEGEEAAPANGAIAPPPADAASTTPPSDGASNET